MPGLPRAPFNPGLVASRNSGPRHQFPPHTIKSSIPQGEILYSCCGGKIEETKQSLRGENMPASIERGDEGLDQYIDGRTTLLEYFKKVFHNLIFFIFIYKYPGNGS